MPAFIFPLLSLVPTFIENTCHWSGKHRCYRHGHISGIPADISHVWTPGWALLSGWVSFNCCIHLCTPSADIASSHGPSQLCFIRNPFLSVKVCKRFADARIVPPRRSSSFLSAAVSERTAAVEVCVISSRYASDFLTFFLQSITKVPLQLWWGILLLCFV